jgi:ribosomal protein S18 acetylase RimI-like enzyme
MELGYSGANEPQMRQNTYPIIQASLSNEERLALINNARHIEYLTPFIPSRGYYLHFLSLAPDCRGKGFGRVFMEHVFERARSKGCTSVHLDVYKTNPATQYYQSFGFEVIVELHFPNSPGLPPHYRMTKNL